jgi:hypothetical protein
MTTRKYLNDKATYLGPSRFKWRCDQCGEDNSCDEWQDIGVYSGKPCEKDTWIKIGEVELERQVRTIFGKDYVTESRKVPILLCDSCKKEQKH